jgi:hypothetical protein
VQYVTIFLKIQLLPLLSLHDKCVMHAAYQQKNSTSATKIIVLTELQNMLALSVLVLQTTSSSENRNLLGHPPPLAASEEAGVERCLHRSCPPRTSCGVLYVRAQASTKQATWCMWSKFYKKANDGAKRGLSSGGLERSEVEALAHNVA